MKANSALIAASGDTPLTELAAQFDGQHPREILRYALEHCERTAISFSGAEDVVLIDMASKLDRPFDVFSIDTGRLHPETYRYLDQVRERYELDLILLSPEREAVEKLTREKGLFSFYQDGHQECCGVRKVQPLRRALASYDAWVTGQRRDQSPSRAEVPTVQEDPAFDGRRGRAIKFNPLSQWTSKQVWEYIRMFDVPFNSLHERGFVSIGCEPCTRATGPNQHEREGRWWWEESTLKECGLHRSQ